MILLKLALLAQLAAFPSAQGGGAQSVGGRGGVVMEVTNLNDSGAGSLRACIEALGPRTCFFRVAGRITNGKRLQISNPFITIAGQTAPGNIVLASASAAQCTGQSGSSDCTTLFVSTHDVVIRYITYDGSANTPTGPDTGTVCCEMASGNVFNVIWDHVTARWWGNKPFVTTANNAAQSIQNITGQWLLLYEPNLTHPVVLALDATSGSAKTSTNQDFHHNMAANYQHRWPLTNIHSMRWVNNLSYNNLQSSSDFSSMAWGGLQGDYIGNKYVDGPQSVIKVHTYIFESNQGGSDSSNNCTGSNPCDNPGPPSIYMVNNIGHTGSNTGGPVEGATHTVNSADQIDQTFQGWEGGEQAKAGITIAPVPASWFRPTPLAAEPFPIIADPAENLDAILLGTVGNSQRLGCDGSWVASRDSQDARIIAQYKAGGPGTMFSGQFTSPTIVQAALCAEDLDHIYIAYKQAHNMTVGQNIGNGLAANGDTNFNNFINGVASSVTPPPPPPPPQTFPTGSSVAMSAQVNVWGAASASAGVTNKVGTEASGATATIGTQATVTTAGGTFYFMTFADGKAGYVGVGQFTASSVTPPPPASPTVSCSPPSVQTGGTVTCTSNQAITSWTASAGTITAQGVLTAPSAAGSVTVTGTNANGSGKATVAVTAAPPPTCPTQPVHITVAIGGVTVGTMTCTPNATGSPYTCTTP